MSAEFQFSQAGISEQATSFLSADQRVSTSLEGLPRQPSTIALDEESNVSLGDYAHLRQEYLLLVERINMLDAENINLRWTVKFFRDLCIDDFS